MKLPISFFFFAVFLGIIFPYFSKIKVTIYLSGYLFVNFEFLYTNNLYSNRLRTNCSFSWFCVTFEGTDVSCSLKGQIQMEQLQILFCLVQTKSHEEFILSQLVNDEYAVSWSSLFSRVRR